MENVKLPQSGDRSFAATHLFDVLLALLRSIRGANRA
jgi:hypothetical protein